MKNKQYKPGQLITIEGKIYRIKRKCTHVAICVECAMMPNLCDICSKVHDFCKKLSINCYLELVKPKQK